jgi:alpha,alpha-trehalose phosphorylase
MPPVVISSQLVNRQDASAPDERAGRLDPRFRTLGWGADHVMETDCAYQVVTDVDHDVGKVRYLVDATDGATIRLTKFASYQTSRSVPPEELLDRTEQVLRRAVSSGFEEIVASQRAILDDFWERSDVQLDGDVEVQQAVRWNLYQLFQATARAERSGVPSKGLTGHGYEGHYFWDMEIFLLPFLSYTAPRIAKNLLRFRYSMLGKARERAAELDQAGALFPWRTITGEEASGQQARVALEERP